jgi:hypothetical protein
MASNGRIWRDFIQPPHRVVDPDGTSRMIWTYDPHPTRELFIVEEHVHYVIKKVLVREIPRARANTFAREMGERALIQEDVAVFWCFSCSHAAWFVKERQKMIGFNVRTARYQGH